MDQNLVARVDSALMAVREEVLAAAKKHPPMKSPHEGYSVILEELDELWDDIKADCGRDEDARAEATQVAAMGVRYMLDIAYPGAK